MPEIVEAGSTQKAKRPSAAGEAGPRARSGGTPVPDNATTQSRKYWSDRFNNHKMAPPRGDERKAWVAAKMKEVEALGVCPPARASTKAAPAETEPTGRPPRSPATLAYSTGRGRGKGRGHGRANENEAAV